MHNAMTTNSVELENICNDIWPEYFQGIYPADKIIEPINKNGDFIIFNNQNSSQQGEHWLALFNDCRRLYVFDTYNRDYKSLNKNLKKYKWIQPPHEIMESKYDQDCGQRTLAFIACSMKFGCDLFFQAYAE